MTSQRVRVAVLGAGIGRQHLRGYMGVEKAQVTAICDLDLSRAEALAAEFGANDARIFTDINEFLVSDCADAVSLCLPNFLHARIAEQCFEAGLDVLCEKPLAINTAEAIQIAEAAKKYDRICMIGQVLRFRDDVLALKESADEFEIYYARAMARRVNGIPKWGGWFTQQKLAGGGPLIDTGVHMIDLAWWFAGCPTPVSASATNYAAFGKEKLHLGQGGAANENGIFDVEDLAAGLVRFKNGFSIHFEASWAINAESDSRYCHLHGKNGAIIWNDNPKLLAADGSVRDMPNEAGNPFQKEMEHFVDCVIARQTPDPDVSQGVTMMKILDALYESARIGREVEIV